MNVELTVKRETRTLQQLTLDQPKGRVRVGRDPSCDLVLTDNAVSPEHLLITCGRNGLWVADQDSINGTFVNESKIRKTTRLHTGDVIRAGATLITVNDKERATAKPAAPADPPSTAAPATKSNADADRTRRIRLLLVLAALLLLATALVFVKKARMARAPAVAAPATNAPTTSTGAVQSATSPAPTNEIARQSNTYDVVSYLTLGQNALVDNELIKAAYYFRKILDIETNNVQARQYLDLIGDESLGALFNNAKYNITTHDMQAAELALDEMRFIHPGDRRIQELTGWMEAENTFIAARTMYQNGDYREAYAALTNLVLINDQARKNLMGVLLPVIQAQNAYDQGVAAFKDADYATATEKFAQLAASSELNDDQKQHVAQYTNDIAILTSFRAAVDHRDLYAAVQTGREALDALDSRAFPKPAQQVQDALEALRKETLGKTDELAREADACLQRAEAEKDTRQRMALNALAYRLLVVLDFLSPDADRTARMETLKKALDTYVQTEYQQGYILESIGQYPEAFARFRNIVELQWQDSRYFQAAREKLKQSKLYNKERKELERAKESL